LPKATKKNIYIKSAEKEKKTEYDKHMCVWWVCVFGGCVTVCRDK